MASGRKTAQVAKSIQSGHQALYIERARRAIPLLVHLAGEGSTIRYGELALEVGAQRGRNMNFVLGSVGATLDELSSSLGEEIPLLQALAVSKSDELPGKGFESAGRAGRLIKSVQGSRRDKFELLWQQAAEFSDWPKVLSALGLSPSNKAIERAEAAVLEHGRDIGPTQKQRLQWQRLGQALFKWRVAGVEKRCRVTKVETKRHLRASHIKPWARSSDAERLDRFNGLLLSPHVDHLFDEGYISFGDDGKLQVSALCDRSVLRAWGIKDGLSTGKFRREQKVYLAYHRHSVFKKPESVESA
jgi:hypothetical protein